MAAWALLAGGCAGRLYNHMPLDGGGAVYVGMSAWELTAALGPPHSVGRGNFGCHYSHKFLTLSPGSRTVEYAWHRPKGTIVAWVDGGVVSYLGHVPREEQ